MAHAPTEYTLRCPATHDVLHDRADEGPAFPLVNPHASRPALLRAQYGTRGFRFGAPDQGVYRFARWLPITTRLRGSSASVAYRSERLARHLGLKHLWISFTGYWPERGARSLTGTFKEHEAYAVYGRMGADAARSTLVVASAGNTARAFLRVASENDLPLVVVVPEVNLPRLWTVGKRGPTTTVVAAGDGADYSDAITLAGLLTQDAAFLAEGGAKNVARRDGMGTSYLAMAAESGEIPEHYFQAVGSGTGAIAAWEANGRLNAGGFATARTTRLHLAQNAPFTLLVDAWANRTRELPPIDDAAAKAQIARIDAKVLANRNPPYSPIGGLYDALTDSDGMLYAVDNHAAATAKALFAAHEGAELSPAAAVAAGALLEAIERQTLGKSDLILLNATGGGFERARAELETYPLHADIIAGRELRDAAAIANAVREYRAAQRHPIG